VLARVAVFAASPARAIAASTATVTR